MIGDAPAPSSDPADAAFQPGDATASPGDAGAEGSPAFPDSSAVAVAETPHWNWLNPLPTGNPLHGVWTTPDGEVWLVGENGTIFHGDETHSSSAYDGSPSETLYTVWGSSKTDVWVGGTVGNVGELLHWNGSTWSSEYSISGFDIHSVWGTAANDVWALVSNTTAPAGYVVPSIAHWDGSTWTTQAWNQVLGLSSPYNPDYLFPVVRDLWGPSPNDVWAVGDGGVLLHWDGTAWTRTISAAVDGGATPQYFGVWGRSSVDVWAMGEVVQTTSPPFSYVFSHWDGAAWTTTTAVPNIADDIPVPGTLPWKRGHRVWGDSQAIWASGERTIFGNVTGQWSLGGFSAKVALGPGLSQETVAVGSTLSNIPPSATSPLGTTETWDQRWSNLFPGTPNDLNSVNVVDGETWARTDWFEDGHTYLPPTLVHWTTNGWETVGGPIVGDGSGRPYYDYFDSGPLAVVKTNDFWAGGQRDRDFPDGTQDFQAIVAHSDGKTWGATYALGFTWLRGLWASRTGSVWAAGDNGVKHWDGAQWNVVSLPPLDPSKRYVFESASGTGDQDVWLAGFEVPMTWIENTPETTTSTPTPAVFVHWDGVSLKETQRLVVAKGITVAPCGVFARASNDAYAWGFGPLLHWDGSRWSPFDTQSDLTPTSVWASDSNNVWISACRYGDVLNSGDCTIDHYEKGARVDAYPARTAFFASLGGDSAINVWAVGAKGTTVRFGLDPKPVTH